MKRFSFVFFAVCCYFFILCCEESNQKSRESLLSARTRVSKYLERSSSMMRLTGGMCNESHALSAAINRMHLKSTEKMERGIETGKSRNQLEKRTDFWRYGLLKITF